MRGGTILDERHASRRGATGFGYPAAGGDWNIVPKMVMWGSSAMITETDVWSLRKTWHEIKGNFGY